MEWKHELDELIKAGLGDIPQASIPPNWRDLVREVDPPKLAARVESERTNAELDREMYGDPQELTAELEAKEHKRQADLVAAACDVPGALLMAKERFRDLRSLSGRYQRKPQKRRKTRRTWGQVVLNHLAEMDKRRQISDL